MARCIFCKSTDGGFNTREHILPESLGGGEWAVLRAGLLCDSCQNRFGSHIEQQALADYPFSFFRVFLGVPTKKGKAPWFESWEGTLRASLTPGSVGYDPAPPFEAAAMEGSKTQIRLVSHPLKPEFVCRTLLKMGLEVVANDEPADVFDERYDAARSYALNGGEPGNWWYLQREDMVAASRFMTLGISTRQWQEGVRLGVTEIEDRAEIFHLRLLYLDLFVPLEARIQPPPMEELPEPEFRLFVA